METYIVLPEPPCTEFTDIEVRGQSDNHDRVNVAICATGKITDVVFRGNGRETTQLSILGNTYRPAQTC